MRELFFSILLLKVLYFSHFAFTKTDLSLYKITWKFYCFNVHLYWNNKLILQLYKEGWQKLRVQNDQDKRMSLLWIFSLLSDVNESYIYICIYIYIYMNGLKFDTWWHPTMWISVTLNVNSCRMKCKIRWNLHSL